MTLHRLSHLIVLAFGVVALAEAVWGLAWPRGYRRLCAGWSKLVPQVNTLAGGACIVVALALLAVVLIGQPLVNWLLVLFALLAGGTGFLYFKPSEFQAVARALIVGRSVLVVRVVSLAAAVVGAIAVVVAVRGL